MAKKVYVGVNGVARKIKKGYIGDVYDVARKIKKAYIGIGGVARPCWSGGDLVYYGTITGISYSGESGNAYVRSAASVGNYAIFAGRKKGTDYVDVYNKSLTHSNLAALSGCPVCGTTLGGYAIFANYNISVAYNTSLTQSNLSSLGGISVIQDPTATTVGSYALFAGGNPVPAYPNERATKAYNSSLTLITATTHRGSAGTSTTVGNYALFAGGAVMYENASYVDAYNTSLTRSDVTALSKARNTKTATTVGSYALFLGGCSNPTSGTPISVVDAYNYSLTRSVPSSLSVARYVEGGNNATTIGDFALIAGGETGTYVGYSATNVVDVYNSSLVRTTTTNLSVARRPMAVTLEDYAIFAGGTNTNTEVDVYTIR